MVWILLALGAAAGGATVNVIEKTLLHKYIRSPLTLPFIISFSYGIIGGILLVVLSWPDELPWGGIFWAVGSGILWAVSAVMFLRILFSQEVSRAVPVFALHPIFTAIIAVTFLGERLLVIHWIAIVASVLGAMMIVTRRDQSKLVLDSSFYALVGSSILFACSSIAGKQALDEIPVINTYALRGIGGAGVFFFWCMRRSTLAEVKRLILSERPAMALIVVNSLVVAQIPMVLVLWTFSKGPVSLVSALFVTHSFFVLLFSTLLTLRFKNMLGESVTKNAVIIKFLSVALIATGVVIIVLSSG